MSAADARRSRVRLLIVTMLFLVTTVNYADRATLSIAGPALSKELHLDPVAMGYVFSAFGWSYVIAQVPCGWLLDRYGSKWVYAISIIVWSVLTAMQGMVGFLAAGTAVVVLFALRFLVGIAEAPSFPANARIVAAWFPGNERGTASAFFNSGQYFATVIFAPLMGWIAHEHGWSHVFYVMGGLGIIMGIVWIKTILETKDHPAINEAEFDGIKQGGALVDMDAAKVWQAQDSGPRWDHIRQLLANRMMLGVYIGQYCINTLIYFFLTWFPVYLVKERGLSILQARFRRYPAGAVRLHFRCARRSPIESPALCCCWLQRKRCERRLGRRTPAGARQAEVVGRVALGRVAADHAGPRRHADGRVVEKRFDGPCDPRDPDHRRLPQGGFGVLAHPHHAGVERFVVVLAGSWSRAHAPR